MTTPASIQSRLAPGLIEGFFGHSWSWDARHAYASWLARHGYGFYLYAPKDDACLRRHWWQSWDDAQWQQLEQLRAVYRAQGVAFGIGLTPLGAHHDYTAQRPRLEARVAEIEARLQPDIFAVLFDDMPSDTPDLAALQVAIAHDIAGWTRAPRLVFCPSFYSTDPILEKVFGAMPDGYWQTLAQGLDSRFDLFWTGPKVCSTDYPTDHLQWVSETLGRKPFLWDNYPVNDGRKASDYLYLRGFTDRPARLADALAGHAVNPMKQPWLSQLPLATLTDSYAQGDDYNAEVSWRQAARNLLGDALAAQLEADLPLFADRGLPNLSAEEVTALQARYQPWASHPAVGEILAWLRGEYVFDPACLTG